MLRIKSAKHHSYGSVWVEHDSDVGTSSASSDVLGELDSNHAVVSMGAHDGTPLDSISGVVGGGFNLVDIGNSLTHVELGALEVVAVLDGHQSLVLLLMVLGSSEGSEDTLLIESNWLSFVVDGLSLNLGSGSLWGSFWSSLSFFSHSFSFVIMIIE